VQDHLRLRTGNNPLQAVGDKVDALEDQGQVGVAASLVKVVQLAG
jgi:hypothetical protein